MRNDRPWRRFKASPSLFAGLGCGEIALKINLGSEPEAYAAYAIVALCQKGNRWRPLGESEIRKESARGPFRRPICPAPICDPIKALRDAGYLAKLGPSDGRNRRASEPLYEATPAFIDALLGRIAPAPRVRIPADLGSLIPMPQGSEQLSMFCR